MKYISNILFYFSISLLFSYFSFFIRLDESSIFFKTSLLIIPLTLFVSSLVLFLKINKIIELTYIKNIIIFAIVFLSSSFFNANLYSHLIYISLNDQFESNNNTLPDIEYSNFQQDKYNNNREKLFFYLNNKGYINSIEIGLSDQVIKFINELNNLEIKNNLKVYSKDNVITEFEFNSIKDNLILNFKEVKKDEKLYELYKLTFVYGINYGKFKSLSNYPY